MNEDAPKGYLEKNAETIKFAIMLVIVGITWGTLQSQVNENSKAISKHDTAIVKNDQNIQTLTRNVDVLKTDIEYIKENTDKTNRNLDKLLDRILGN